MIFYLTVIFFFGLCYSEKFYINKENDETFAFNKSYICTVNVTDNNLNVKIFNPFYGDIDVKQNIIEAENRRILACFNYNRNFYMVFFHTKENKIEIYKNGKVRKFSFPSNFIKVFYDTFTEKFYVVMKNRANELDLELLDKNYETVNHIGYKYQNVNFDTKNSTLIDFSIFNNTIYYITKGNSTNMFYRISTFNKEKNEDFYYTFREKINFVIIQRSENKSMSNSVFKINPQKHEYNNNFVFAIQYIFDALLIMAIIYLYKCTKNKLDSFRKEYGLKNMVEINNQPLLKNGSLKSISKISSLSHSFRSDCSYCKNMLKESNSDSPQA
jgi:hypothetical protein